MLTSKAFRCTLPMLRDDQIINLRLWADLHCAQSIVFHDDRGSAVFVGLTAQLRTCASLSRTVRTALRRLCIDVPLRGRWCTLITPREALNICASDFASRGAALPPAGDAVDAGARQRIASAHADGSDVRIVALSARTDRQGFTGRDEGAPAPP